MTQSITPNDSPRRDPDPRSAFGNDGIGKMPEGGAGLDAGETVGEKQRGKDELDPPVLDATNPDNLPSPIAEQQKR